MTIIHLLVVATALCVAQAVSLLVPAEGVRGLGRMLGGLGTILLGALVAQTGTWAAEPLGMTYEAAAMWFGWCGVIICSTGLVTILLGARKFSRRNLAQDSSAAK